MKSPWIALTLALCLTGLAGCRQSVQSPAPSQQPTAVQPSPVPSAGLEDVVAQLEPEALTIYGYAMGQQADGTPNVTAEALLPLLRQAMEHRRDDWTGDNAKPWPGIWSLELTQEGVPTLLLSAGLTDNLVELSAQGGGDYAYLDAPELYQLLRTMRDDPAPSLIDQDAYERYRDVVDDHFDRYFADSDAQVDAQWELTGFTLVERSAPTQTEYWLAGRVYYTDPPELILSGLAGGDFVDSALRLHPVASGYELLQVQNGQAQGFVYVAELTDLPA